MATISGLVYPGGSPSSQSSALSRPPLTWRPHLHVRLCAVVKDGGARARVKLTKPRRSPARVQR